MVHKQRVDKKDLSLFLCHFLCVLTANAVPVNRRCVITRVFPCHRRCRRRRRSILSSPQAAAPATSSRNSASSCNSTASNRSTRNRRSGSTREQCAPRNDARKTARVTLTRRKPPRARACRATPGLSWQDFSWDRIRTLSRRLGSSIFYLFYLIDLYHLFFLIQ